MHKRQAIRIIIAAGIVAGYLAALRYILPSGQPYFILGIGVVAAVAWLSGTLAGLLAAFLLIPATRHVYEQLSVAASYSLFLNSVAYLGLQIASALSLGYIHRTRQTMIKEDEVLREANENLQGALSHVQELGGVHNLCSECKKILTDDGIWQDIDLFLHEHTKMEFSHCICTDCAKQYQTNLQSNPQPATEDS